MTEATVDALFRWFMPVEMGGRQIWMRTLGATDDTMRARKALAAARKHRAALSREGSPERKELISELDGLGREDLLDIIRVTQMGMAQSLSVREVHPEDPPEPASPTLDDVLDAEDEKAEQDAELGSKRKDWAQEHTDKIMGIIAAKDDDELLKEAIDTEISSAVAQVHMLEFSRQTLYRSCYQDKKFTGKTFASADEVGELDRRAFNRLLEKYNELDRFSLRGEELKN